MAKLYGEIAKSALLTLDKSFSRALGQPLDASEVYYSLAAAKTYAATPAAYVGQKIVVIENGKVTHYSVEDAAGTLKEVGVKPIGDGKSITVSEAGIVSILGVDTADSLTLPRMKEDKSGVEWVPVSQVVQGDGNDNTTYEITALTKGEGDAAETYGIKVKTLFNGTAVEGGEFTIDFDVYTKSEADDKFLAKADYTPYDDTALAARVKAIEDDYLVEADKYDDTALAARVKAIEDDYLVANDIANKADKATTLAGYGIADAYTKTEVEGKIDDAVKGLLGENVADAYDTLKEIQDLLAGTDGEAIDGLIEIADANKVAIEVLNGDASTAGSVDKKIADAVAPLATTEALNGVKATAEAAQTADEVSAAIEAAFTEANLGQYAVAETVNAALDLKANAADVVTNTAFGEFQTANTKAIADAVSAHEATVAGTYSTKAEIIELETEIAETYATKATTIAGYGITDAYTKNEVDAKIGVPGTPAQGNEGEEGYVAPVEGTGVFANTYSKTELNALLDKIEGGSTESAASVARQLDEYKTSNNQRVANIEAAVGKDVNGEEAATGLFAEVDAARAQADKGVEDAGKNAAAIKTINTTLESHNTAIQDNATEIGKLKEHDIAHTTQYNTLVGIVDEHTEVIATKAETSVVNGHATKIGALETAVETINTVGLPAINEAIGKKADADKVYTKTEINGIVGADKPADKTIMELIAEAQAAATYDDTAVKKLITDEAARADAAEKVNAKAIADETARADAEEKRIVALVEAEASRADAAEKVNAKAISDETARAKAAEEKNAEDIAKIDAVLNTISDTDDITSLKELALWVEEHGEDAAEMAGAIAGNTAAIQAIYTPAEGDTAASGVLVSEIARVEGVIAGVSGEVDKLKAVDHAGAHAATLQSAKDYANGLAGNYATKAQGDKADTAVQSVTCAADMGIKATRTGNNIVLDWDPAVELVFCGGDAGVVAEA